jgi:DNA-binding NarL/FixJ family response regulator
MQLKKILLCEKNEYFKEALLQIIQSRFPDIDIKWISNGNECVAATAEYKPDILILGANIYTGTNELDILQLLRKNHPAVNIVLFTDYTIEEYRKEAILRGATHIISKETWTGNEILALMKTILASRQNPDSKKVDEISAIKGRGLDNPLEQRRKDRKGRAIEEEYLAHHPDRRNKNII